MKKLIKLTRKTDYNQNKKIRRELKHILARGHIQ
jgi:hypothetical protein